MHVESDLEHLLNHYNSLHCDVNPPGEQKRPLLTIGCHQEPAEAMIFFFQQDSKK